MKLGAKMLLAPALLTAVAISAGLVYGWADYREGVRVAAETQADSHTFKTVAASREDLAQVRGEVYRTLVLLASMDDKQVNAVRAELGKRIQATYQPLLALAATAQSDAPIKQLTASMGPDIAEYAKRCDKAIDLSRTDPNIGAASMRAADDSFKKLTQQFDQLVALVTAQADERAVATEARQKQLQLALALALLVAGAGAATTVWRLQRRVVRQLHRAVAMCEDTAKGHLTAASNQMLDTSDDEIGDLQRALGRMVKDLDASLSTVRDAADQIHSASTEIASGNLDLSQRTEQAASSLQQTATAMEELTGTVAQTAESARTANQLAQSARSVAQRGGEAVSQVVNTMQDINTSSKRIADIISTIDGIAFQTNILALNAAVEAARAGEQGRGFAVVATEVRSLAQRSATAAREIKTLIGASMERVEAGTQQVASAGSTMNEIVASVQRVSDIIGEISAAAAEQSSGIGQVNGSVADLDDMTQQNAALVEQSAAAAESLTQQAKLLTGVVSHFDLSQTAPAAPAATRATTSTAATLARNVITQAKSSGRAATAAPSAAPKPAAPAAAPPAAPAAASARSETEWESF